ncbi:MAG: SDR family oxidoreductase, partial [Tistlia sp.]
RLRGAGMEASGLLADANDPAGFDPLFERVAADAGRLDLLINCQGINIIKPAAEFTAEDYDAVLDTNLKSVFFACQAARRRFLAQDAESGGREGRRGGAIINIASLSAHRGWAGAVVYGVSKHGIAGLTQGLAAEWAAEGIRVNAISPGFFMTDMNRERMSPARKELALARTPLRRFGEVEELAGAAVYLASDAAGFVTGADIAVDGGFLASGL